MRGQTIVKKEKIKPSETLKKLQGEKVLMKLEKLGEKITKTWKSKKTAVELIEEGRR